MPSDVFVDKSGNIYVADYGNNRIQKWMPGASEGITVAGGNGPGNSPQNLHGPLSVYVDGLKNIYIGDYLNDRIQKWDEGMEQGTTIAGTGKEDSNNIDLNGPAGIFIDYKNKLYVADVINNRVQMFLPDSAHAKLPDSTYKPTIGGNYQAFATFENCNAASNKFSVTSLPRFKQYNGQTRNLCGGGTFTYSVQSSPDILPNSYQWKAPSGCTILNGQGTTTITLQIPSGFTKGNLRISAKSNCGRGPDFSDELSTKPSVPDSIVGPYFVTAGEKRIRYSTTKMPGTNYYWQVPYGAQITRGQGTSSVTVE